MGGIVDIIHETHEGIFVDGVLDTFARRLHHGSHFNDGLGSCSGKVAQLCGEIGAVLGRHCGQYISHYSLDSPLPGILCMERNGQCQEDQYRIYLFHDSSGIKLTMERA